MEWWNDGMVECWGNGEMGGGLVGLKGEEVKKK
jgi:hypothetical protein